jgi:hypothetical protein
MSPAYSSVYPRANRNTFDGVWDAIMAEYEHIVHPAQLAHHADKISAVKHKGQSLYFRENSTQLPIQPLKLLMVSQTVRGLERVKNMRRHKRPMLPTIL